MPPGNGGDALAVTRRKRERSASRIDEDAEGARAAVTAHAGPVHGNVHVASDGHETERPGDDPRLAPARGPHETDLRGAFQGDGNDHRDPLRSSFVRLAENRRDARRLEAVSDDQEALRPARERCGAAGDEDRRRGTHRADIEPRLGRVTECVRDRLTGEGHLEKDRGLGERGCCRPAHTTPDPFEQSGSVDRPRQPAPHIVETRARNDVVRSVADAKRDEVRGFDLTVGMSEHERGRSVRDVDGEGARGRRRGERPRAVLDEGVTQHDIVRARAAERAKRAHQRGSVREPLELERIGTPPKRLAQPRFDQREDARRRLLSGTSETECFKELGERRLVLGVGVHDDDFGSGFAEGLRGSRTLSKLASQPKGIFSKATSFTPLGGGFYAIKEPKQTITIGVAGNQLVAGKASVADLRAFAGLPTTPAAGAQGSVAFRVGLAQLLRIALKAAPPKIAESIFSSLGDITGWLASSPSALTGNATLALK